MNAQFDETRYRPFNHAISCLSRFGDKFSVLCLPPGEKDHVLRLSAINSTGSAFCAFFLSRSFFETYNAARRHDLQLQVRSVQSILKSQVNRHLELVELELLGSDNDLAEDDEADEDVFASRFAFRLHGKNGVVRTHKLTYEDKVGLFPRDDAADHNVIEVNVKTISELLDHFASKTNGDITMQCTRDACRLTSLSEDVSDKNQRRSVATRVQVDPQAFKKYDIVEETTITFGLREFKAGIALADHLRVTLTLRFSSGGRPLSLLIECQAGYLAHIFIATSAPEPGDVTSQPQPQQQATREAAPQADASQANDDGPYDASQNGTTSIALHHNGSHELDENGAPESGSQAAGNARARGDALASTQPGPVDTVESGRVAAASTRAAGPIASTPVQARRFAPGPQATNDDTSMASAGAPQSQSQTQMEESLFRGMGDFDEGDASQQASQVRPSQSRFAAPTAGTSAAPSAAASQLAAEAPTQPLPSAVLDELPSVWPDDTSLTFDEETRLVEGNQKDGNDEDDGMGPDDSSALGATDDEDEEELPETQQPSESAIKRMKYTPLV